MWLALLSYLLLFWTQSSTGTEWKPDDRVQIQYTGDPNTKWKVGTVVSVEDMKLSGETTQHMLRIRLDHNGQIVSQPSGMVEPIEEEFNLQAAIDANSTGPLEIN